MVIENPMCVVEEVKKCFTTFASLACLCFGGCEKIKKSWDLCCIIFEGFPKNKKIIRKWCEEHEGYRKMDWKRKKRDGRWKNWRRFKKFYKETGNVRKGWIWATIRFVRFSCHRSCVYRGYVPHSSPWGPLRARCPCLSSPLCVSKTMGPEGCSPCCQGPDQNPLSLGLCSPHCRRKRTPEKMDAGPPAASLWSRGT